MKPPIIIYEHGDISVFASPAEACSYVEPIDVRNNEYVAYDSAGVLLSLEVIQENKKSFLWRKIEIEKVVLKSSLVQDADGLSEKIRTFLIGIGVPNLNKSIELSDLVRMLSNETGCCD